MLKFKNALVALETIVSSFSSVFMLVIVLLLLLAAKLKRSGHQRKLAKEILRPQPLPHMRRLSRSIVVLVVAEVFLSVKEPPQYLLPRLCHPAPKSLGIPKAIMKCVLAKLVLVLTQTLKLL
jgi:hypothetical protein